MIVIVVSPAAIGVLPLARVEVLNVEVDIELGPP
jgi:hypothetical protein